MGILDVLSGGLNAVDLVPSIGRDLAANALTGEWRHNPLDQLSDPFGRSGRLDSGRDVLREAGLVGDEDTWGNFAAGLASDTLIDAASFAPVSALARLAGPAARSMGNLRGLNKLPPSRRRGVLSFDLPRMINPSIGQPARPVIDDIVMHGYSTNPLKRELTDDQVIKGYDEIFDELFGQLNDAPPKLEKNLSKMVDEYIRERPIALRNWDALKYEDIYSGVPYGDVDFDRLKSIARPYAQSPDDLVKAVSEVPDELYQVTPYPHYIPKSSYRFGYEGPGLSGPSRILGQFRSKYQLPEKIREALGRNEVGPPYAELFGNLNDAMVARNYLESAERFQRGTLSPNSILAYADFLDEAGKRNAFIRGKNSMFGSAAKDVPYLPKDSNVRMIDLISDMLDYSPGEKRRFTAQDFDDAMTLLGSVYGQPQSKIRPGDIMKFGRGPNASRLYSILKLVPKAGDYRPRAIRTADNMYLSPSLGQFDVADVFTPDTRDLRLINPAVDVSEIERFFNN